MSLVGVWGLGLEGCRVYDIRLGREDGSMFVCVCVFACVLARLHACRCLSLSRGFRVPCGL